MNSIVEAEIRDYLRNRLHYDPYECGAIVTRMRELARVGGYDLNHKFAGSGLGAGPEARIAAGIVDLATGGGGCETATYVIRKEIDQWLRTSPPTGMIA